MIIWAIIAVVLLVIDVITSAFLFCWFSLGALIAIVVAYLGGSVITQTITFILVGCVLAIIGYPLAKKKFKVNLKKTKTMEEEFIGRNYISIEDIKDEGRVSVGGSYWTAINLGEELIKKGDNFLVVGFEGNKIKIIRSE